MGVFYFDPVTMKTLFVRFGIPVSGLKDSPKRKFILW